MTKTAEAIERLKEAKSLFTVYRCDENLDRRLTIKNAFDAGIAALEASAPSDADALRYVHLAKGELRGLFYTETEAGTKPPKAMLAMNDDETVKGIIQALDYLETATAETTASKRGDEA